MLHLEKAEVSIKDKACCLLTAYLLLTSYAAFVSTRKFSLFVVGAIEHAVRIKKTHGKNLRVFIGYQFLECLTMLQYNIFYNYLKLF